MLWTVWMGCLGQGPGGSDPVQEWAELADPCGGVGPVSAMHHDGTQLWVGCSNGAGLHRTLPGSELWEAGHFSADLYVFDLRQDDQGRLLACGHDYDGQYDGVVLWRRDGDEWTDLLWYGNNADSPNAAYLSNCGQVATNGDNVVVFSNTIGDMVRSTDGGETWAAADRYWEQANLDDAGTSAHQVMRLHHTGGWHGSGSTITEPPLFYRPSDHVRAEWWHMQAVVVSDAVQGEAWALDTPDAGTTWVIGGRDQSRSGVASGFLFVSQDAGATWSSADLGAEIDVVRDVRFDGPIGVAVGDRYPPASLGGFVLVTTDGGQSWSELDVDVPADLRRVIVSGESFWIGGNGYMAQGNVHQ